MMKHSAEPRDQSPLTHYSTYSEGRASFKDMIDAAESGRPVSVQRDTFRAALVDAERMLHYLMSINTHRAEVVYEAGGCSVFLPGLPFGADGNTLDEAVETLVDILREYALDWTTESYLREAPNHRDNWALVQIIALSTDAQLREWIAGEAA